MDNMVDLSKFPYNIIFSIGCLVVIIGIGFLIELLLKKVGKILKFLFKSINKDSTPTTNNNLIWIECQNCNLKTFIIKTPKELLSQTHCPNCKHELDYYYLFLQTETNGITCTQIIKIDIKNPPNWEKHLDLIKQNNATTQDG